MIIIGEHHVPICFELFDILFFKWNCPVTENVPCPTEIGGNAT
jgi:hypothetical protein